MALVGYHMDSLQYTYTPVSITHSFTYCNDSNKSYMKNIYTVFIYLFIYSFIYLLIYLFFITDL